MLFGVEPGQGRALVLENLQPLRPQDGTLRSAWLPGARRRRGRIEPLRDRRSPSACSLPRLLLDGAPGHTPIGRGNVRKVEDDDVHLPVLGTVAISME